MNLNYVLSMPTCSSIKFRFIKTCMLISDLNSKREGCYFSPWQVVRFTIKRFQQNLGLIEQPCHQDSKKMIFSNIIRVIYIFFFFCAWSKLIFKKEERGPDLHRGEKKIWRKDRNKIQVIEELTDEKSHQDSLPFLNKVHQNKAAKESRQQ